LLFFLLTARLMGQIGFFVARHGPTISDESSMNVCWSGDVARYCGRPAYCTLVNPFVVARASPITRYSVKVRVNSNMGMWAKSRMPFSVAAAVTVASWYDFHISPACVAGVRAHPVGSWFFISVMTVCNCVGGNRAGEIFFHCCTC